MPEKIISDKDKIGSSTLQAISNANKFNRWMYENIRPYIKGNVLEIGSGIGNISEYLLNEHKATLSDINPDYCHYLQNRFKGNVSLEGIMGIDLVDTEFDIKYAGITKKYGTVVLLNVIEHIKEHDKALINIQKLLSSGGRLIMLAPSYEALYCKIDKGLGHYRRYTKDTMQLLLENNGFNVVHSQYFNFTGILGWYVFGKLLGKEKIGNGEMKVYETLVPIIKIIDQLTNRVAGLSIIQVGIKQE